MKKVTLFAIFFTTIMVGCKVSYLYTYDTYLENSPIKSLTFTDSLIRVDFYPLPNGVQIDIENLSPQNLYLDWEQSYFIKPDGSTSKALNTDILETSKDIVDKDNNVSIIPKGSHFIRFTCSAKDIDFFAFQTTSVFHNRITNTYNISSGYSEFFKRRPYWLLGGDRQYNSKSELPSYHQNEAIRVQEFILNNNNLGLGFTLKYKGTELEYHFRLPIKSSTVFMKTSDDTFSGYLPVFHLAEANGFRPMSVKSKKK